MLFVGGVFVFAEIPRLAHPTLYGLSADDAVNTPSTVRLADLSLARLSLQGQTTR